MTTGSPIRVHVPVDVSSVDVTDPTGTHHTLSASHGSALLPRAVHAGFYYFSWQGRSPASTLVAVNLSSADESDPTVDPLPITRAEQNTALELQRPRDITPWFALLALLLLLADVSMTVVARSAPRRRAA
jgi:hypothetical protein